MFTLEEKKETNSGLVQGIALSKSKVPKPTAAQPPLLVPAAKDGSAEYYSPADFAVGASLNFFGRELVVTDADQYTREWHARVLGTPLGPAVACPDDGYRAQRQREENPLLLRHQQQQQQLSLRQQQEGQAGAVTAPAGKPKKPLPYQQRDPQVLRFYCAYEDERQVGGRRQYTLYYYVSDSTLEIKETAEPGRHHFPNFLSRQSVCKEEEDGSSGDGAVYEYHDLRCGAFIKVYGRHLLLLSCDASTREWYAAKGIQQVPLHVASSDSSDPPVQVTIGPPNGFGTDDDVYAMGLRLEPGLREDKHVRLEKTKAGSKVLRFIVHLLRAQAPSSATPGAEEPRWEEDVTRDLVLNYFECDSTICIYEPRVRNSGVEGGLFLSRGKYKKMIDCRYKKSTDGAVGGRVALGGSHSRFLNPADFLLTAAPVTLEVATTGARLFTVKAVGYDAYTRKILEESGMVLPEAADGPPALGNGGGVPSAVKVTLKKQAEAFVSAGLPLRAVFRTYDSAGTGVVAPSDFAGLVRQLQAQANAVPVTSDELVALIVAFGRRGTDPQHATGAGENHDEDGGDICIFYDDYVDALSFCAPKSVLDQAKEAVGANKLGMEERLFKALAAAFFHGDSKLAFLRATFRELDVDGSGHVSEEQWFHALKVHGLMSLLTKSAASTCLLQYDMTLTGSLSYHPLCDTIFALEGEQETAAPASPASATTKKLAAPTVKKLLGDLTHTVLTCDGNHQRQLENAMHSFCSCFSRLPRKRILRKIYTAFNTSGGANQCSARSGRITRQQFEAGIRDTAAEFHVDFSDFDRDILGQYLFPDQTAALVAYEPLLEVLCVRDLEKLASVRQDGLAAAKRLAEEVAFEEVDGSRVRDFGGSLKVVGFAP